MRISQATGRSKEPRKASLAAIEICMSGFLLSLALGYFFWFWLFSDAGWLHPELLSISDFIWLSERRASTIHQLSTVFDWHVFDSSPYRLRAVSDITEVIDAIARPSLSWVTGLRPSVSLTALPMSIATIAVFFLAVRGMGVGTSAALLLTTVFVSTIGFQSCYIPYIRPAKRLALLGYCLTIFFILRSAQRTGTKDPYWLFLTLEFSFLSDESGFAFYPISLLLFLPQALKKGEIAAPARRAMIILAPLPLVHALVAYAVLPQLYGFFGTEGARDQALAPQLIGHVLTGLIEPDFYRILFENLTSEMLATFGIIRFEHGALLTLGLVTILACCLYYNTKAEKHSSGFPFLVPSTVTLIGLVAFLTLIDRYNWPQEANYLGALTYYYHSVVSVAVLLFLTALFNSFVQVGTPSLTMRVPLFATVASLLSIMVVSNFAAMTQLNRVVQQMHLYELEAATIRAVANSVLMGAERVSIDISPRHTAARFADLTRGALGPRSAPFERVFAYYIDHPMGTEQYLERLVRAFYPNRKMSIRLIDRDSPRD
jgi:hypothetical protein